jgi:hypothetical protein
VSPGWISNGPVEKRKPAGSVGAFAAAGASSAVLLLLLLLQARQASNPAATTRLPLLLRRLFRIMFERPPVT